MDFDYSPKVKELQKRVQNFMEDYIYPNEEVYYNQLNSQGDRWQIPPVMEELKAKAKTAGQPDETGPADCAHEDGAKRPSKECQRLADIMA